jgi:hypothetical protein
MALRVSCATPVAGPVGGLLGVGFASAAAGQASIKCRQYLESGRWAAAAHTFPFAFPGCVSQTCRDLEAMLVLPRQRDECLGPFPDLPSCPLILSAGCACPDRTCHPPFFPPRRTPLQDPWRGVRSQDVLLDALLGVALFKARCGAGPSRCRRRVLPR